MMGAMAAMIYFQEQGGNPMTGISRWLPILAKRSHRKMPATKTEPRRSPFPVPNKKLVKRRRALSLPGLREEAMTAARMAGNGQSGLMRWRYGSMPTDTKAIPGPTRRRSPPGPRCPREGRLHTVCILVRGAHPRGAHACAATTPARARGLACAPGAAPPRPQYMQFTSIYEYL